MDRIRNQFERDTRYENSTYKNRYDRWTRGRVNEEDVRNDLRAQERAREEELHRERRNRAHYDYEDRGHPATEDAKFRRNDFSNSNYRPYGGERSGYYEGQRGGPAYDRRDSEPSYISTYKNYSPRGGRRIERSMMGENEMRQSAFRHSPDERNGPYNYDREARRYNGDDYRWDNERREYSRYHHRGRGNYARGDYDTEYDWGS